MHHNYAPNNKFLWDSWFLKEDDTYHVFYLQADKTDDPELRHNNNVSIGHAISKDLINWEELPTALEPSQKDEDWDSLSLWTGCVLKKDNVYYMFYTGRTKDKDSMWIQKIGLATSHDLIHWEKYENNPLLEAKEHYYIDNEKNMLGKIGAFRDPDVFYDKTHGAYFMLISARESSIDLENKTREYNGCIALLESQDLLNWKYHKPILNPKVYDEMETAQMIFHNGVYYLFFSTLNTNYSPEFTSKIGSNYTGLHCYYATSLFEEFKPINQTGVVLNLEDEMYVVRIIEQIDNQDFIAIGWLNNNERGEFVGSLSKPFTLRFEGDKIYKL